MTREFSYIVKPSGLRLIHGDQNGSMIVIVLMLLALMSIIGIASTTSTVTENFIVRNTGIRKQNLHLADAAAMEVVQRVLDAGLENDTLGNSLAIEDILPSMPAHEVWVNDKAAWEGAGKYQDWYDRDFAGPLLGNNNSVAPASIVNGDIDLIVERGDWDGVNQATCPIRYALVGWEFKSSGAGNLNLAAGQPILRSANILTEYLSERNGVIRLTVGVEREFMY